MEEPREKVVVIGAGMGGLAAAIRLAASGCAVTVVDMAEGPGGKARAIPSDAGPVDTGPTVLTMRHVFDALFALGGARMEDHIRLIPQPILARHWWPDGSSLDLFHETEASIEAIRAFAGPREAEGFIRFDRLAKGLYDAFEQPVMLSPHPDTRAITRIASMRPQLWPALLPGVTLEGLLRQHFRDPRLVQLFARYATYVGGRPGKSPGVLALIWRAEATGVWAVEGGMHGLALALAQLAQSMGVRFRYATKARRIVRQGGRVTGVEVEGATTLPCRNCVFNGDPGALVEGHLGDAAAAAVPAKAAQPHSLSAWVWAFAARPHGADLIHHNVFFTENPRAEFGPIGQGRMPEAPTLYICAQDRAAGAPQDQMERFEIIMNAPSGIAPYADEEAQCRTRTFSRLKDFGLTFSPDPAPNSLTTPAALAKRYPGSQGAIYGRSPEGLMAAFQRPQAKTALPGLYLAGGGAHPGAGVPMAALSGQHAAEAIKRDRISASKSAPTVMPGGTSMGSALTGRAPSR
ncbi:MAG: phytoene desaturase [Rhodobacteraceae bacterium]|nr:phytoene desaturase [Paracoccaceae bacterium]MCF8514256.1 phytoene desaturase [Paracoccaceae bacterium]MCF8518500.1 phytoene desaturase [Paracoccaceae bacterium]